VVGTGHGFGAKFPAWSHDGRYVNYAGSYFDGAIMRVLATGGNLSLSHLVDGKGQKDRDLPLTPALIEMLLLDGS